MNKWQMYFKNALTFLVIVLMAVVQIKAWNVMKCDGKNDAKVKKGKSSALLYAHRCFLKDVPIKVPSPLTTIPENIVPSHVVVPRCSGNNQDKDSGGEILLEY
jgi:hypothetical protein